MESPKLESPKLERPKWWEVLGVARDAAEDVVRQAAALQQQESSRVANSEIDIRGQPTLELRLMLLSCSPALEGRTTTTT